MKTAMYWHKIDGARVQCDLCPHACCLGEGGTGLCRVRTMSGGELKCSGYGLLSSSAVDPIEKKPLYHFHPGSRIFSIGGWGCNLSCRFCQNWTISQQSGVSGDCRSPHEIVESAFRHGSIGIAYTYNEPLINIEFVRDCAELAKARQLTNVLVTNGHIKAEPAADLLPLVDAMNVDIKSIDPSFYRRYCGGYLEPVLAFVEQAAASGCLVELTNLVIPGLNDGEKCFADLSRWIRTRLGETVPLHLSAYFPRYKLDIPPTPVSTLERAYRICSEDLAYVYVGNIVSKVGCDTLCPGCGTVVVSRRGYAATITNLRNGNCAVCGRPADLVVTPRKPDRS